MSTCARINRGPLSVRPANNMPSRDRRLKAVRAKMPPPTSCAVYLVMYLPSERLSHPHHSSIQNVCEPDISRQAGVLCAPGRVLRVAAPSCAPARRQKLADSFSGTCSAEYRRIEQAAQLDCCFRRVFDNWSRCRRPHAASACAWRCRDAASAPYTSAIPHDDEHAPHAGLRSHVVLQRRRRRRLAGQRQVPRLNGIQVRP